MTAPTTTAPGTRASVTRAVVLVLVALATAAVHLPGRPPTLCLLRATTGIPCPLCGGTTATVELGQGRLLQAFLASPLTVLGAVALVLAPLRRPLTLTPRAQLVAIGVVALLSELWQLHRFGFL